MAVRHLGTPGNAPLHPAQMFQHFARWAAPAIAMPIDKEQLVVLRLLRIAAPRAHHVTGLNVRAIGRPDGRAFHRLGGQKIGRHLGPIQPLPPEGFIGNTVGVVPAHFMGDKNLKAGQFHQLRQRSGIAECIGQPHHLGRHAKGVLVIADAFGDVPDQAFTAGHIRIRL